MEDGNDSKPWGNKDADEGERSDPAMTDETAGYSPGQRAGDSSNSIHEMSFMAVRGWGIKEDVWEHPIHGIRKPVSGRREGCFGRNLKKAANPLRGESEPPGRKKTAPWEGRGFLRISEADRSALGELEALAGTGLAGLFAFLHARVAGQEAERLDDLAVFRVHLGERAGDRVADGDGLGVGAAALDDDLEVELVHQRRRLERREDGVLKFDGRKVFFERTVVDGDLAGAFGHPDAGDGGFAAAGGALSGGGGHVEKSVEMISERRMRRVAGLRADARHRHRP